MKDDQSILGLASIRRNRGVSLQQIADSTKLSVRFLEAIENGDFRKLPGGVYNINYIRQYARAIDYDEAVLLAYYRQHTAPGSGLTTAVDKTTVRGLRAASSLFS